MIVVPNIFERLCLRLKAGDETAAMKEPAIESDTGREAQDGAAPHSPSFKQDEQIYVPQGMVPFDFGKFSRAVYK
jgi:hypothetical protein